MTARVWANGPGNFQVSPRDPSCRGIDTSMRVDGSPERWLVAARISRMSKQDRMRGDEAINGIQTQDRRAAEWAASEGHVIVHVTKDRNISGACAPWERPQLGPWLTDPVKLVQYDGIVAYDVSRLSREYFDMGWLRKWAATNGKKLYVIKDRLHWPDDRDGVLWGVAAERAYQERQEIIERVVREMQALIDAGKLHGRPPFGFTTAGMKWDRYLVPTETGRKYVPLIFQHCIEGWSQEKIVDWLYCEGITPVSGTWWPRTIGNLIRNPTYKGHRCQREIIRPDDAEVTDGNITRYCYDGHWVDKPRWEYGKTIHECEELVTAAVWKRANEALSNRPKRGHVNPDTRAMLAGALYCPRCEDSPMYRHRATSKGRPYYYYRCFGRGSHRQSCGNMVRVELVDGAVCDIIAATFDVKVMHHVIVPGNEAELEAALEANKYAREQLAKADLTDDEEDAERARLRAERDQILSIEMIPDHVELVETDDSYLQLWDQLDLPERGAWLAQHGFRVTAGKERVAVHQGTRWGAVLLNEPQRRAAVRNTEPVYYGKCKCGCGTDLYRARYGRKIEFVDAAHRQRDYRRRAAANAGA